MEIKKIATFSLHKCIFWWKIITTQAKYLSLLGEKLSLKCFIWWRVQAQQRWHLTFENVSNYYYNFATTTLSGFSKEFIFGYFISGVVFIQKVSLLPSDFFLTKHSIHTLRPHFQGPIGTVGTCTPKHDVCPFGGFESLD